MIPVQNIVAWGNVVPWAGQRQVEQDLIIGRALVEIFSDDMLRDSLRVRGGTAINKLHFPKPMCYSEDIDLVRTSGGPIGPILDRPHCLRDQRRRAAAQRRALAPLCRDLEHAGRMVEQPTARRAERNAKLAAQDPYSGDSCNCRSIGRSPRPNDVRDLARTTDLFQPRCLVDQTTTRRTSVYQSRRCSSRQGTRVSVPRRCR